MAEKYAKDLKAGDKTEWYEVLSVTVESGKVIAEVRFNDGGTDKRVWDEPNTIVSTIPKVMKLEWGISPPTERAIAWGARAIYKCPDGIDLLWDRMGMVGGEPEQRKAFSEWLNKKGIPALKEQLRKEYLPGSSEKFINIHLDGWFITASPRGSCGYLYIGVFPEDNGDPTYVPEPVDLSPPPPPAPKRRQRRAR